MKLVVVLSFICLYAHINFTWAAPGYSQVDSAQIAQTIKINWQAEWEDEEKRRIRKFLLTYGVNAQLSLGELPFPLNFYIRHREQSQPVGGCAAKFQGARQGVHLAVDLRYSDNSMLESWRLPHEIAHLHLPKLGKQNEWFYEGFATFMSRQIMLDMGLYSDESLEELQRDRFDRIREDFDRDGTFYEVVIDHQDHWNFAAYYWGGCSYFYRADRALRNKYNTTLKEIIKEYQKEGRQDDNKMTDVIYSWDEILGKPLFSTLMRKYRRRPAREVMGDV